MRVCVRVCVCVCSLEPGEPETLSMIWINGQDRTVEIHDVSAIYPLPHILRRVLALQDESSQR